MASVGKYNVSQMQLIFYFILSILKLYYSVLIVTMLKHVMVILNYITKYYAQYQIDLANGWLFYFEIF